MLYFIPAWYKQNTWTENEQKWYIRRMTSEFDETIKQITLFHRNVDVQYQIINLAFAPNFRHFLHRQGMFRAQYWSCFDAMMQVRRKKATVFSYKDIMWPDGVEFIYSSFAILVYLKNEKFAKIDFGEDGNPIIIEMYENGQTSRINYYDDRGFVGSSVVYENGIAKYRDYLMENGIWKLREYCDDGHVEINPNFPYYDMMINTAPDEESKNTTQKSLEDMQTVSHNIVSHNTVSRNSVFYNTVLYEKDNYESMDEIIEEVLNSYIQAVSHQSKSNNKLAENDKFFVAAHPIHMDILERCLNGKSVVMTFFEDRYDYNNIGDIREFLSKTSYVITDSKDTSDIIRKSMEKSLSKSSYAKNFELGISEVRTYDMNITDISPYDARPDFGISPELNVQNILVPIDGIAQENFELIIKELAQYMTQNEFARVHIFTRNASWGYDERVQNDIVRILSEAGFWSEHLSSEPNADVNPDSFVKTNTNVNPNKFIIDVCVDERTISKCINEQRVILDLRETVDVFLFITAISKGVPRISKSKDQFFEHKKNGYLIDDYSQIKESISYYLDSMDNWNKALVECYEIGKKYTTEDLLSAWRRVLGIV